MLAEAPVTGHLRGEPFSLEMFSMKQYGHGASGARRCRCAICGTPDSVRRLADWCVTCREALRRWRIYWYRSGGLPRCPEKLRQLRIKIYRQRAAQELDLFEPPLS